MPLYSFTCNECQHDFEMLVRSSDTPACPRCSSANLHQWPSRVIQEGKSKEIIRQNRRLAAAQGHFSNYSREEREKLLK